MPFNCPRSSLVTTLLKKVPLTISISVVHFISDFLFLNKNIKCKDPSSSRGLYIKFSFNINVTVFVRVEHSEEIFCLFIRYL